MIFSSWNWKIAREARTSGRLRRTWKTNPTCLSFKRTWKVSIPLSYEIFQYLINIIAAEPLLQRVLKLLEEFHGNTQTSDYAIVLDNLGKLFHLKVIIYSYSHLERLWKSERVLSTSSQLEIQYFRERSPHLCIYPRPLGHQQSTSKRFQLEFHIEVAILSILRILCLKLFDISILLQYRYCKFNGGRGKGTWKAVHRSDRDLREEFLTQLWDHIEQLWRLHSMHFSLPIRDVMEGSRPSGSRKIHQSTPSYLQGLRYSLFLSFKLN